LDFCFTIIINNDFKKQQITECFILSYWIAIYFDRVEEDAVRHTRWLYFNDIIHHSHNNINEESKNNSIVNHTDAIKVCKKEERKGNHSNEKEKTISNDNNNNEENLDEGTNNIKDEDKKMVTKIQKTTEKENSKREKNNKTYADQKDGEKNINKKDDHPLFDNVLLEIYK